MAEDSLRQEIVDTLTKKPGNSFCVDCGQENPEWASVNLSIFLCIECAGIHRRMGTGVSRVKSVKLDRWTPDEVENIKLLGNVAAKLDWEALVPPIWPRPSPTSKQVCREQWIRAKYERREFMHDSPDISRPYMTGQRQGFLYKRKRNSDDWNSRYFVLDKSNLSYFINATDSKPKAAISLLSLNITFNIPGEDPMHPNSLLISYFHQGKHRNLFVYSDTSHEIMDWYLAIRCAKFNALKSTSPQLSDMEILEVLMWDFTKTGYLFKMPPSQKKFQKRFFILDRTSVRYYNKPTDAYPLGVIMLGHFKEGYEVLETVPDRFSEQQSLMFMLKVPYRSKGGFPLLAVSEQEKTEWIDALKSVIEDPRGRLHTISMPDDTISCYENEKEYSLSISSTGSDD